MQPASWTETVIHDADHNVILSAPIGSTVHDKATVTGTAAGGIPTGDVTFTVYLGTFFFNDTATTEIYTLSLHDALPILAHPALAKVVPVGGLSYKATYNG